MKRHLLIFLCCFLLGSCTQVYFLNPQPQKGTIVKSFINEIQGNYTDSILSVEIGKQELIVDGEHYKLTDGLLAENEVLVKYYKDFYFANFKDSLHYTVFMAKFYDQKLAVYMLSPDQRSINVLGRFVKVEPLDREMKTYLIDPSKKEFEALFENGVFEVVNVLMKK